MSEESAASLYIHTKKQHNLSRSSYMGKLWSSSHLKFYAHLPTTNPAYGLCLKLTVSRIYSDLDIQLKNSEKSVTSQVIDVSVSVSIL